jgi:hypothetical protein
MAAVAGVVGRSLLIRLLLALEALVRGPGLDQRPVDGEVLVAARAGLARLLDHRREEKLGDFALEQAVSSLNAAPAVTRIARNG